MPTPPIQTSFVSTGSYFDVPPADIVPQRSPTVLRPASLTFSDSTTSEIGSPNPDSHMSEEARCFAQFQSNGYGSELVSSRRPPTNRTSAVFEGGLPSLTNTPSSSVGTAASWSSYRPLPPRHDPSTGHFPKKSIDLVTPTFPTTVPPSPTQFVNSVKSSASTMTSFRCAEAGDVSFDRRRTSWRSGSQTSSSLKELLSQDARKHTSNDH